MNFLNYFSSLDNLLKYGFIIFNFVIIAFLITYNKYYKNEKTTEKKNLLLVIAHPDDESMYIFKF